MDLNNDGIITFDEFSFYMKELVNSKEEDDDQQGTVKKLDHETRDADDLSEEAKDDAIYD